MDIKKVNVNDKEFEFVCGYHNTRDGFAHDCTMFINGTKYNTAHCYYLNRTWERWSYQTVCLKAISNEIAEHLNLRSRLFKDEHGYKNMTKKRMIEFEDTLKDDTYLTDLKACYADLKKYLH